MVEKNANNVDYLNILEQHRSNDALNSPFLRMSHHRPASRGSSSCTSFIAF